MGRALEVCRIQAQGVCYRASYSQRVGPYVDKAIIAPSSRAMPRCGVWAIIIRSIAGQYLIRQ